MVSAEELRGRVESEPAVLIYFKNDNCAPCLVLRPKVKELIDEFFPNIEMIVIDSVQQPEFAGEFQVYANPTLLVFFDGNFAIQIKIHRQIGYSVTTTPNHLKQFIPVQFVTNRQRITLIDWGVILVHSILEF